MAAAGGTGVGGSGVGGGSLVRTPSVKISSVGLMTESVLFVGSVLFATGVGTGIVVFAGVGAGCGMML